MVEVDVAAVTTADDNVVIVFCKLPLLLTIWVLVVGEAGGIGDDSVVRAVMTSEASVVKLVTDCRTLVEAVIDLEAVELVMVEVVPFSNSAFADELAYANLPSDSLIGTEVDLTVGACCVVASLSISDPVSVATEFLVNEEPGVMLYTKLESLLDE